MTVDSNNSDKARPAPTDRAQPNRRAALAKLGLATIVAYGAPSIVHLARAAQAGPSKGGGGSNCGKGNQPPCP